VSSFNVQPLSQQNNKNMLNIVIIDGGGIQIEASPGHTKCRVDTSGVREGSLSGVQWQIAANRQVRLVRELYAAEADHFSASGCSTETAN